MKVKSTLTLLLLSLLLCCGNDNAKNPKQESSQIEQQRKKISARDIESFKYKDYTLSEDAQKEVLEWSKFQELSTQISFLKKADVTFFTSEKDTLKSFLDSLKLNIPEIINTNPVIARVTVLETKLLKLNDDLLLQNYNLDYKLNSIKELLIANSNLIYVINKKLEFDQNDVERPDD